MGKLRTIALSAKYLWWVALALFLPDGRSRTRSISKVVMFLTVAGELAGGLDGNIISTTLVERVREGFKERDYKSLSYTFSEIDARFTEAELD